MVEMRRALSREEPGRVMKGSSENVEGAEAKVVETGQDEAPAMRTNGDLVAD